MPAPTAGVVGVEWPAKILGKPNTIALVPLDAASLMVNNGYARLAVEDDVTAWNTAYALPPMDPALATVAPVPEAAFDAAAEGAPAEATVVAEPERAPNAPPKTTRRNR